MKKSQDKSNSKANLTTNLKAESKSSSSKNSISNTKTIKHTLNLKITPDKYFVMCDGRKITGYKELAEILRVINDDIFNYHVNDQRNDFSTWINDVFDEKELSKKILIIRNRLEMSIELYKHLFETLEKNNSRKEHKSQTK